MARYKVYYTELVGYWNKYVGAWGGKAKTYKFKGYKNGELVKEAEVGPSNEFDLRLSLSKEELINEDTYDSLRIRVEHVDEHGNLLQYSQRILNVEVSGPIELIGPHSQSLLGGQLGLFIKSKNEKGTGKVIIKMDNLVKTLEVPVR